MAELTAEYGIRMLTENHAFSVVRGDKSNQVRVFTVQNGRIEEATMFVARASDKRRTKRGSIVCSVSNDPTDEIREIIAGVREKAGNKVAFTVEDMK